MLTVANEAVSSVVMAGLGRHQAGHDDEGQHSATCIVSVIPL